MPTTQTLNVASNSKGGSLLASFALMAPATLEVSIVAATCRTSLRPGHEPLRSPGTFSIFPRRNGAELVFVRLCDRATNQTTYSLIHVLPVEDDPGIFRASLDPVLQEQKIAEDENYQVHSDGRLELTLGATIYTTSLTATQKCDFEEQIVEVPAGAIMLYLVDFYDEKRLARTAKAHAKTMSRVVLHREQLNNMQATISALRTQLTEAEARAESARAGDLGRIRQLEEDLEEMRKDMEDARLMLYPKTRSSSVGGTTPAGESKSKKP